MSTGKNILLYEPAVPLRAALAEALTACGFEVTVVTKMPTVLSNDAWLVAGGDDPLSMTALLRERLGEHATCFHLLPPGDSASGPIHGLVRPFRLQDFVQQLTRLINRPRDIDIGPHRLHVNLRQWQAANGKHVALTEKEVAILLYLAEQGAAGRSGVPRDELLHKVWGYHPEATTHTLETHIYRLRQKIDPNPDNPQLLVTKDEGYSLA